MTTGEKIFELRKKARITQEDFADKLGVSHQAVSKWESDAAFPETDTIIKIADLFGVSLDYLLKDGAPHSDNCIGKRNRSFLSMMQSFAIAVCLAGFLIALVCYYAVSNRSPALVGLGVLAGFLLVAFVLWSVGRYLFLSKCEWSDSDKRHLAKWSRAFLYTAIITAFVYLPAVVFVGLRGMIIESFTTAVVYRRLSPEEYLLSALVFGFVGYALSAVLEHVHKHSLGAPFDHIGFADAALFCFGSVSAALVFSFALFGGVSYGSNLLVPSSALPFFLSVAIALALLAQAVVHRVYEKTTAFPFAMQIAGAILVALNCLDFYLLDIHNETWMGAIWVVAVVFSYAFGALLLAAAVTQMLLAILSVKKTDKAQIRQFLLALPVYLFPAIALPVCYWKGYGDATQCLLFAGLIAALAGVAFILQIVLKIKKRK